MLPDVKGSLTRLLEKARAGGRPYGIACCFPAPEVVEVISRLYPFDYFLIDQEHTLISGARELTNLIRAIEPTGAPMFVKLNAWDRMLARDAMDAGVSGVMVPFVESGDQMREIQRDFRFPPLGQRGFCDIARAMSPGYLEFVNRHALVIPQIESRLGVDQLDDILAAGADCPVFGIGPTDLAISLELDGTNEEDRRYLTRVLVSLTKKLRAAGKLLMQPSEWPVDHLTLAEAQQRDEVLGNDMPYTVDMSCFMVGLSQAMKLHPPKG
jgi:2-keto-3-deoxy-L-rhamnonate aldolase RhmA